MNVLDCVLAGLLAVSLALFARLHSRYQRLKKQRTREVRVATRPMMRQIQRLEDADAYLSLSAQLMAEAFGARDFRELEAVLQRLLPHFDLPKTWKVEVATKHGSPCFSAASEGLEEPENQSTLLHQHLVEVGEEKILFYLPDSPEETNFHLELIGGEIFRAVSHIRNAFIDGLTGVWSRQYLLMRLGEEIERAHRHRHWISMLMLDGDHFKQINDKYGHGTGDDVIRALSHALSQIHNRSSDIVARFGGDEFLVMLPETTPKQAIEDAERARSAISNLRIKTGRGALQFTCSVGVYSVLPNNVPTNVKKMLKRVDDALYAAKAKGGNCVVAYKNGSVRGNSGQ